MKYLFNKIINYLYSNNKKLIVLIFLLLINNSFYAQQSSDYFPSQLGYKWNYKISLLDSLNNSIDSLEMYSIDSLASNEDYAGKNANIILTKAGTKETINYQPYMDSLFVNLDGTDANVFFRVPMMDVMLSTLDSINLDSNVLGIMQNIIGIAESFKEWHSYFKFAQNVDSPYEILKKDTTITIDTSSIPLRIQVDAVRKADENLSTFLGNFITKKFIHTYTLFYILKMPPNFEIPFPIVSVEGTSWIAPNHWLVKTSTPPITIDLSLLGYGKYNFPASLMEITDQITDVNDNNFSENIPSSFKLEQNYPNPFNPTTTLSFAISQQSFVSLKVYDVLGKEVATLVNEEKPAGTYKVTFDAGKLSSGVYFYKLQAGNFVETKKMILMR